MQIGIDWGRQHLDLEVPDEKVRPLEREQPAVPLADPALAVAQAVESPLDFPALRRALTPDDHVAILVDQHLPQLGKLLVPIFQHLEAALIEPSAVTLVCAPPAGDQQWIDDLPEAYQEVCIEIHQPDDRKKLAYLAATKHQHRIYLNRTAVDADQLIILSRRWYDCRAGYAGGESSLFPSLSDEPTLKEAFSHLHANAPGPEPWKLPREAAEVAWLLGAPFLVQVIEGVGDTLARVVAGPIQSSAAGRRELDRQWRVTVAEPAALVVATLSGNPARHTFDDLSRAFLTASRVVAPGGRIVVLSEAKPDLGSGASGILRHYEDASAALKSLQQELPSDLEAGFMWAKAASRARLYLLSGLEGDVVEEMLATPLEKATQVANLIKSAESCIFLRDAHKAMAVVKE